MGEEQPHRIVVHLDELLEARGMTLAELARRVGISAVNLSCSRTATRAPCGSPRSPISATCSSARPAICWSSAHPTPDR